MQEHAHPVAPFRRDFPLNVMYWAVNEDGTYEVLDGQQRTISFCQYAAGDFSININGHPMAMHNLTEPHRDQILDYELMVYICEGNDQDKLDWFTTINIAGAELTAQELRNAVYTGPWLTHAKSIFSKTLVMDDETACYEYRAMNSFGASLPSRAVMLATGKMVTKDQDGGSFSKAWNGRCANKSGREIAKIIEIAGTLN